MSKKPIISVSEIDDLKAKGWTQAEIARHFGVTRGYISWIKATYGGKLTPREKVLKEHYPWKVTGLHLRASLYKLTRNHAEYMETGGVGMADADFTALTNFHKKLRDFNLVVEYDPDIPPSLDSKHGGWALRARAPEDGDLSS